MGEIEPDDESGTKGKRKADPVQVVSPPKKVEVKKQAPPPPPVSKGFDAAIAALKGKKKVNNLEQSRKKWGA